MTGTAVVKKVRTSTWQAFDALIAVRCGTQSTLLLGINKDTRTAYLHAVGHAIGAATPIKGLGKVGTEFTDKTYFRHFGDIPEAARLYGE